MANHFARQQFATHTLTRNQNFGAEATGLFLRAFGELCAADALGKPQIVFDLRTAAGLAANCRPLYQHRP